MVFVQVLMVIVSAMVLALTISAIMKGPDYIATSNSYWDRISLIDAIRKKEFGRYFKKLTPFAIAITFVWAGYSVANDFFWFVGDIGYIDKEYGEWRSYRIYLSSGVGGGLGLCFSWWLILTCEKLREAKKLNPDNPTTS